MKLRIFRFFLSVAVIFVLFTNVSTNAPYVRKSKTKEPGYPVILVPGDGGSQLEANLTGKPSVVHYLCAKQTSDWWDLWLNLQLFTPVVIDCWLDNMQLVFNTTSSLSMDMPGVDVRVPGFGQTETIEWLDKSKASSGLYFFNMVDMMTSWGYRRGKNVAGAPYDWRRSPNELNDYLVKLKELIENVYKLNDNKKVVIVAHSMGNPTMLYFYNNYVTQDWKDKYIKSHVGLAGPWGGSMQIVKLYASGYNMNYYRILLSPNKLRQMQRSFSSSAFLFPNANVFNKTTIIAKTDSKNYTLENVEEFFTDIKYETGYEQYKAAALLNADLKPPGVEVHCVYGTGLATPEQFSWGNWWFPDYQPTITYGDGDGTVNRVSAEACQRWNKGNNNGKDVKLHEIANAEHMGILQHPGALEIVRKVLYDEYEKKKSKKKKFNQFGFLNKEI
ncbi:unnamed protein product [Auanema sp. JU1783]|nr:unnamed protein product [Auanema sp. JU1783]